MGLSNSLNTGVSALRGFERGMDVVGNNIANVNTTGYKSERMEYKESFSNLMNRSYAGAGNPAFGVGSTANQIGMGITSDTISTNFNQGQIDVTNVDTDMAITGHGFFKVIDSSTGTDKTLFTRAGNFTLNTDGYLVTHDGKFVQGLSSDTTSLSVEAKGTSDGQGTPADSFTVESSDLTSGAFTVGNTINLPTSSSGGSGYYDTENGLPTVTFIGDGAGAEATAVVSSGVITGIKITNAGSGYTSPPIIRFENPPDSDLSYTVTTVPTYDTVGKIKVSMPEISVSSPTTTSAMSATNVEGQAPSIHRMEITGTGKINLMLSNGDTVAIGQILLQRFKAPQNLTRVYGGFYKNELAANVDNKFDQTGGIPGSGGLGDIRQGALELSNSDLTENFSDLILTQRAFQGAARIVTTSDEIVKEAINLKR